MHRALAALGLALVAAGCSSHSGAPKATSTDSPASTDTATSATPPKHAKPRLLVSTLGLPRVHSAVVPGYVLIADRNNNRVLLVSPSKQVVWRDASLIGPD
ncbi:MAG TPA: hypothetical protein VFJ75_03120, partial [Gaiellaceae bacterium]|nr:hypothetical protein [Gaiellaceae bacterium]